MLLDGDEMNEKNYVIPTAILRRLLDAAVAGRYCNGDASSEIDTQVSDKLGLHLVDAVGIQSVLEQLLRLQSSPSSSSSSSDVASDYPPLQHVSKKSPKSSTVVVVNPARYKTELCRQFEEHGSCRYGDKCQFAHGVAELRTLARHPKYKTEMCRTFHTTGFCPYGLRCHFIHNDDERHLDSVARCPPSPPSLSSDPLLLGQPHSRPIFSSSASMSPTLILPEVDSAQRGRPILARSSTLPDRSCVSYPYIGQPVTFLTATGPHVTDNLTTSVHAPCA